MKSRWLGTIVCCLVCFACSSNNTIRIGFLSTLSGSGSMPGVLGRNGCELAVEKINRSGGIEGRKIQLLVKDVANDPDLALKAVKELKNDGVIAVIAHSASGDLVKVRDYVDKQKIVLLTSTASASIYKDLDDYLFRIILPVESEAKTLAETAYRRLKIRKMAAVYNLYNLTFTEEFTRLFREEYESMGGRIVLAGSYQSGSNENTASLVRKIVKSGAQGIFTAANSMDNALFCQLLARENSDIPVLTGNWSMTEELLQNSGRTVGRFYLTGDYDRSSTDTNYLHFKRLYDNRFRSDGDYMGMLSYETAMILLEALKKSIFMTSESLREVLLEQKVFRGLQYNIEFNATGDAIRPALLFRVIDGHFRRID